MYIVSRTLSQGGCDVGVRHTDKVLGNPGREAWEGEGGRRGEPAAGALRVQPGRPCLVWLRKACIPGLAASF